MNPKVDAYLAANPRWQAELTELRRIVRSSGLTENVKWGVPCYTLDGANVALLHVFKEYCAILFVKGSLLADPDKVLIVQTQNVQAGRQVRFTGVGGILKLEGVLKAYLAEAVALEQSGAKVAKKNTADFPVPEELTVAFAADAALKSAFDGLTPGRQRAYLLFFAGAKQSATRQARIVKMTPNILAGKGLDD